MWKGAECEGERKEKGKERKEPVLGTAGTAQEL